MKSAAWVTAMVMAAVLSAQAQTPAGDRTADPARATAAGAPKAAATDTVPAAADSSQAIGTGTDARPTAEDSASAAWEHASRTQSRPPVLLPRESLIDPDKVPDGVASEPDNIDYGVVTAPALGITTRTVMANPLPDQSRFTIMGMLLFPTSGVSQVRFSGGVPASKSVSFSGGTDGVRQDFQLGIEHEWGLRYFGLGMGYAYRHMHEFTRIETGETNRDTIDFQRTDLFNRVLSLRIGKPNAGFRGRISTPLIPIMIMDSRKMWIEYSAMAVFGGSGVKAGLGVQGAYTQRLVTRRMASASAYDPYYSGYTYSYYGPYEETRSESYLMLPCTKIAFLVGSHSVVTISGDLGSILYHRNADGLAWAPNLQAQYVFCFGELKGANALDGTY